MASSRALLVAALGVSLACSPAFLGQDDGFHARIPEACATEVGCRELRAEARQRMARCQPNTIGYVRCDDARADSHDMVERISDFAERRRQQERARELAKLAEAEVKAQQELVDGQRRQWLTASVAQCRATLNTEPCSVLSAHPVHAQVDIDDDTRAECFTQCRSAIGTARDDICQRALADCVSRLVVASGKDIPDCHFQVPVGASDTLEDERVQCAVKCKSQAGEILALASAPSSTPTPPAVAVRAASSTLAPWPSSGAVTPLARPAARPPVVNTGGFGGALLCCDGTISPTCACPGHQGCCSHHRGVCGCR